MYTSVRNRLKRVVFTAYYFVQRLYKIDLHYLIVYCISCYFLCISSSRCSGFLCNGWTMYWWKQSCQGDSLTVHTLFRSGATLFLIDLCIVGWIKFGNQYLPAAIFILVCSAFGWLYWYLCVASK